MCRLIQQPWATCGYLDLNELKLNSVLAAPVMVHMFSGHIWPLALMTLQLGLTEKRNIPTAAQSPDSAALALGALPWGCKSAHPGPE